MDNIRISHTPTTHIGWGALDKLITEIEKFKGKILIIADPVLLKIGILDKVIMPVKQTGFQYEVYTDIEPEPSLATAENLITFVRKNDFSLVIGVGGGSALDLAKLAAVFIHNDGDLRDYLNLSSTLTITNKGIPKILIPTTSGTGTEVTNISVLALEHTKDVIAHDFLISDLAIIDPQLTLTVPAKITASTGADALTHAIEAFISVNANAYSDSFALQAIRMIGSSLKEACLNGSDREARIRMAYGSYFAGLAFFNAGVGAVHALAYPLGGQFHIAHGDSNAVLLPYVLGYIRKTCSGRLAIILEALDRNHNEKNDETAAEKCIEKIASLMNDIGIPQTPGGFDIPASAAAALADDGIKQKRLLSRCPMHLSREDIFQIYEAAFSGEIRVADTPLFNSGTAWK